MLNIQNEFSELLRVIVGLGAPYQRDKERVAAEMAEFPLVPDTDRKADVLALRYPTEALLIEEYTHYVGALRKHGVEVLLADSNAAYSFDYTCPRDIGFVVNDTFYIANMSVQSRADEIATISHYLRDIPVERIVRPPSDCLLEGGDVIVVDNKTVLVGFNQRSNRAGFEFLRAHLEPLGIAVHPVPHHKLHLDCALNPLGQGYMLIHPKSLGELDSNTQHVLANFNWIEVDAVEAEHLATNVLSINPSTVVARNHASCIRVVGALRNVGFDVESIEFNGVPATGGSFRCASLALLRQ